MVVTLGLACFRLDKVPVSIGGEFSYVYVRKPYLNQIRMQKLVWATTSKAKSYFSLNLTKVKAKYNSNHSSSYWWYEPNREALLLIAIAYLNVQDVSDLFRKNLAHFSA